METITLQFIDDINRRRREAPFDYKNAKVWCRNALLLGQPRKVINYAELLLQNETDTYRQIVWLRILGQAYFQDLDLEKARLFFEKTISRLIAFAQGGLFPPRASSRRHQNSIHFADGTAENVMWELLNSFYLAGIRAFPTAGTLLGLVREGKLLTYDKDLDIGVLERDFGTCSRLLSECGWQRIQTIPDYIGFRSYQNIQTGLTLDLLAYRIGSDPNHLVSGFELAGYPNEYQSVRCLPLIHLEAISTPSGQSWMIANSDAFLSGMYGNWRQPNPRWDSMISNVGIVGFTLLTRCYAYDRLIDRWMKGQLQYAWAYAHQISKKDSADDLIRQSLYVLNRILAQIDPGALLWPEEHKK